MIRTYSRPHFSQAHAWTRFARQLQRAGTAFDPYLRKEAALGASFALRSRGLVFSAQLEDCEPGALGRLAARAAGGDRYPELVARITEVDPADPTLDEVHVYLEEADRTGTHTEKHRLGRLPAEDALWVAPLIRLETDAYGTGTVLRYHVTGGADAEVHVAISRAHEAAKAWLDWADDRKAWAEAHAVADGNPYAYRATFRDTLPTGTDYMAVGPDDDRPDYDADDYDG